jgi:acetyl-CoA/propionyl-CoA carboxylase biotin carboxyl carrier protein
MSPNFSGAGSLSRVLIANRGEIALRIVRTLREMGIASTAVYSDADRDARYVLEANDAYRIGPPPPSQSYLNQTALIETALRARCDAVHPGYGFLAENADFAEAVAQAGLTFIGPSPASMRLMGDKIAARRVAVDVGVPVVPGTDGRVASVDEARRFADEHGLPLLVKAGGGGGGRGIRLVEHEDQLDELLERAAREAEAYFGSRDVYLERYFYHARHIEVQVVGDADGNVAPWGERDCSTQRRRQKLIEETPAPGLDPGDRSALMEHAARLAESANYGGVGTVEFLNAGSGQLYFLEMNTRIQVEHTVTEQVTGLDLVRESILVATGNPATTTVESRGHAIEARINAEDPARDFAPGAGWVTEYREPGGPGVRVDSGIYQGFTIPGDYDSLAAKLIVDAPDRDQAVARLTRALRGFHIAGVPTTIPLLTSIVDSQVFRRGEVTTAWLDANLAALVGQPQPPVASSPASAERVRSFDVEVNGRRFSVRMREPNAAKAARSVSARAPSPKTGSDSGTVVSAMRGTVLAIKKTAGDTVLAGEAVFVVEAMKMENEVIAPREGVLAAILVAVGDTVDADQPLARLEPT